MGPPTELQPLADSLTLLEFGQGRADDLPEVQPKKGAQKLKRRRPPKTHDRIPAVDVLGPMLFVIAALLFLILLELGKINSRFKELFPTEKEQIRKWENNDPEGYWKAHNKDKKK